MGEFIDGFIQKPDIDRIQRYIDWCEKSVRNANDRVAEYNKDTEIQKLQNELKYIEHNSLQVMSNMECQRSEQFRNEHYERCGNGNVYWYKLAGTGVGTAITIKCDKCGEELDITDIDSW